MKIEEAIVYVLAKRNGGLKTDQIEEVINRERLFVCKDGRPFLDTSWRIGYFPSGTNIFLCNVSM